MRVKQNPAVKPKKGILLDLMYVTHSVLLYSEEGQAEAEGQVEAEGTQGVTQARFCTGGGATTW